MKTQPMPELGQYILIVMDNHEPCLNMLRSIAEVMPGVASRYFTLIHCVPALYWEHSGSSSEEAAQVWQKETQEFRMTQGYFDKARAILEQAGVPAGHIRTITDVDAADTAAAVLKELRQHIYTGVILSCKHGHLVNRLTGRAVFNWFRSQLPDVTVWVPDSPQ